MHNLAFQFAGWTDSPLTPEGHRQAHQAAGYIEAHYQPVALYASPLIRAYATAEHIGRATGLSPVAEPDLRECNFGLVENLTLDEFAAQFPQLVPGARDFTNMAFTWPGGENRAAFNRRALACIARLTSAHSGEIIVIVAHGGPIGAYLAEIAAGDPALWRDYLPDNCSISEVHVIDGQAEIVAFNQTAHLTGRDVA